MMSLLELVAQNQPHFQTHKALLVLGLQNDFLQPDGKLPVNLPNGFLDRIHTLIPAFRQQSSNVVWVKTIYEADRLASDPTTGEGDAVVVGGLADGEESTDDDNDLPKHLPPALSRSSKHKNRALDLLKRVSARRRTLQREELQTEATEAGAIPTEDDEELFLRQSAKSGPACLTNTPGADLIEEIEKTDTVVQTSHYSAFQGTSLLMILRARLVTELYICGCITNVSVLATVVDAARHGIKINVVEDCLGFRRRSRHRLALRRMEEFFDANIVTSDDVLYPKQEDEEDEEDEEEYSAPQTGNSQDEERLQGFVDSLRLADPKAPPASRHGRRRGESPTITASGHQRASSHTLVTESSATADRVSDEQFTDKLVQGAKVPGADQNKQGAAKNSLVQTKIRMRSRNDRSKKEDAKKEKAESSRKGAEASLRHPTKADKTTDPAVKSPKATSSADKLRPAALTKAIAKAESSDKLRESPSKDRSLKPSVSHSALFGETKDKSSASRVRLALSRSSKSDSKKEYPTQPSHSPARSTATLSSAASTQATDKVDPAKMVKSSKLKSLATFPTLGPDDRIAEGDSRILYDFFPPTRVHPTDRSRPLKDLIFTQLYNEVRWQKMLHQQGEVPRLVCCQGEFGADGSMPVYRHPTDQTLPLLHFSPKVQVIRKQAEKLVGHPLNHVLIQLYRSGNDCISEHSDKTLDIVKGSSIVNVSFGAQRTMRLRTKKSAADAKAAEASSDSDLSSANNNQRETQRVAMPHNSMFILGLASNEKWLHGIMADKRLPTERSEAENAYSGIRISLTFRHIGTFLDAKNRVIWGQGATSKDQREANDVINDDDEETERMVRAFSRENHSSTFNWTSHYGTGFDVLHLHAPPEDLPILFATNNRVDTTAVKIFLAEKGIEYTFCPPPTLAREYEVDRQIHFRDNDASHTEISIHVPVLAYLDRYYPLDTDARGNPCTGAAYEIFIQISALVKYWLNRDVPTYQADFEAQLEALEERAGFGPGPFVGGRRFSCADCQMWPALDEIVGEWEGWTEERFPRLTEYYRGVWRKKRSVKEVRAELPTIRKDEEDEWGREDVGEEEEAL
ncbi:hypothetical protein CC80DRAFT_491994 [Byssothecium circinans]|uniref:Fe2OG dioxygenase domain-containing protein n=1 Tax=Byssothecium circinans TaxID=147558 RepID=A0A6A5TZP9_9PLEO|nr:hypothetical protein CC80DRAFT_491994 [Byssothecium circinans]